MKKNFKTLVASMMLLGAFQLNAQKFAVFSDIHVTPGNENDKQLREAIKEVNKGDFDYVIINGDLTNEGSDIEISNVKSILDEITLPLIVLPGNHENTWSQSATKTFVDTFGSDRFVFDVDSLVIIGINCGPFMKMGDGHIKQEDLHWLKKTLDERVTPGKKVLSFNHYPIQKDDLDNWQDYAKILLDYPVIGHINGHYHRWMRYDIGDIEGVMLRALAMKGDGFGYSIIDVKPEATVVYNKVIGQDKEPKFALANRTHHKPLKIEESTTWTSPEGFEINKVWTDSASIFTRLGFDSNNVYFGNSLGQARAVDKTTGNLKWSISTPSSLFSRPVAVEKGMVSFPTCDKILYIDGPTGKTKKELNSKEGPYVADGLYADGAYIQGGYKRIEKLNPVNAKVIWSYDSLFNYCQAAPVIDNGEIFFGAWDTNLRCLDLKTGKLKWVWNNGKKNNQLGPGNVVPVITDNYVFVVAPDRFMTAIDRNTGKTLWRDNSHRYRESLGHSEDKSRVYAKTMDGELVAVDATSPVFKELWTVDMGLGYEHAPCIVLEKDGVVYAGSRRGIVTAVDPVAQKVLWSLPLGVSETNGFDVDPATGDVYVSLIEGTIFKISKK